VNFKNRHTFTSRFEHVQKDELFEEGDPLHGKAYTVKKLTLGYIFDFPALQFMQAGVGASVSCNFLPERLEEVYSDTPVSSMVFLRLKL
jgi:hypothetical protein